MKNRSHSLNSLRLILLCPISLVIIYIASAYPSVAEWYAVNIYPVISKTINSVSASVPFSLAEVVVIAFFSVLIIYVLYTAFKLFFSQNRIRRLWNFLLNIGAVAGVICFLFVFMCGINYHRITFSEVSGLDVSDSSATDLYNLCERLANELNLLRPELAEDSNGVSSSGLTYEELANECRESYDTLEEIYPTLISGYSEAKPVHFSSLMSYSGITGIFFAFTYEANVNTDIPEYSLPSTMCHELTHLRGYMREDEANFVAYLACKASDKVFVRYSGYMLAFIYSFNALYAENSELYAEISDKLCDGVKKDIRFSNSYWSAHSGIINDFSDKVNDVYLKLNSQEDGVKSYGRMVDLLIAEMKSNGKTE